MKDHAAPVRSVVLLSGGLDSAANLAFCVEQDEAVLALTIHYGQRAAIQELNASRAFCEYYSVEHRVIELPWLSSLGESALTRGYLEIPDLSPDQLDNHEAALQTAKAVWVPNRNGILINLAASFAEALNAKRVVVGFNREEAMTFPDNSVDFIDRATRSLELSTANSVEVHCYTQELDKLQIVQKIKSLKRVFPFEKVWSCYGAGPKICGICESCRRFVRATQGVFK